MELIYKKAIEKYLEKTGEKELRLKAVLFDMDGVLFDSMPFHAESWKKAMAQEGIFADVEEFLAHEGRTSKQTVDIFFKKSNRPPATDDEIKAIYKIKENFFNECPAVSQMAGTFSLIQQMKMKGLKLGVVTGSAQGSLLKRLPEDYPNAFDERVIVTALDVKHGKPNPEPYLMGLQKSEVDKNEVIVIENAPLGVEAAVKAGIFTIAVNTGKLDEKLLIDAGTDLIFNSMEELNNEWKTVYNLLNK